MWRAIAAMVTQLISERQLFVRHTQFLLGSILLVVGTTEEFLYLHFTLQLHHAIHDGLRTWRTTWNKHINRHDFLNAFHNMIARLEWSATDGTTTNSNHILGLSHLVVQTLQGWGHLVGNGAGTHNQVSLTGRVARDLKAEAGKVITRTTAGHKLDSAARGSESQ